MELLTLKVDTWYLQCKMLLPFESLEKEMLLNQRAKLNKYIQENRDLEINMTKREIWPLEKFL